MKHLIFCILLLYTAINAHSQYLSEVQILDGKMYVEMYNPDGNPINSLKISFLYNDTIIYGTQSEIDSLSQKGAIIVLSIDEILTDGCDNIQFVYATINDSIKSNLSWRCICYFPNTYSISRMDYATYTAGGYDPFGFCAFSGGRWCKTDEAVIDKENTISVVSKPTMGMPNVRDSMVVNHKGRLLRKDGTPYRNVDFTCWKYWDSASGSYLMHTDDEGYFDINTFPSIFYRNPDFPSEACSFGINYNTWLSISDGSEEGFMLDDEVTMLPGIYNGDEYDRGYTSIQPIEQIPLSLMPNPAKESVAVEYELQAGTDYCSCKLAIINANGNTVLAEPLLSASGTHTVDISGLPQGWYLCTVRNAEGEIIGSEKLIVND